MAVSVPLVVVFFLLGLLFVSMAMVIVRVLVVRVVIVGNFPGFVLGIHERDRSTAEFLPCQKAIKEGFHVGPDPENHVGVFQCPALGWLHGVIVGAGAGRDETRCLHVFRGDRTDDQLNRFDGSNNTGLGLQGAVKQKGAGSECNRKCFSGNAHDK
jgi:hypothetical protein